MSKKDFDKLIKWSNDHFSHLPWREKRSLYRTLVSEIMLQQTTVGTVLNHFERFLKIFPDLESLANATEEKLLIEWKGLGYYRRARNLKKIAEGLENNFEGKFPKTIDELLTLKGVGPYTANAIVAMGMDEKALAVDANLERIISRYYGIEEEKGAKLTKKIYELFLNDEILNFKNISYRNLNEALMDLGRVYCKARTVECHNCALKTNCVAFQNRTQLNYPLVKSTKAKFIELDLVRIVIKDKNKVMAYKKESHEWLHGQWELPTFVIKVSEDNFKQYPKLTKMKLDLNKLLYVKTSITKYKITNYIHEMDLKEFKKYFNDTKYKFQPIDHGGNLSTASVKVLKKL